MEFSFYRAQHDRAAVLRQDDWRALVPLVLVVGGDYVATLDDALRWLPFAEAPEGEWVFLGQHDGRSYAAVIVPGRIDAALAPRSLRELGTVLSTLDGSLAVHAVGLARWHATHLHCARCGQRTNVIEAGHTRECPSCGTRHFPRTDPAVIMLITDGDDHALLGRHAAWPERRYSTLAGFVEPGESLEDAVRREVLEEVGIGVGDVRYAGSQPWPFPSSLMLGFFGTADTHDIRVDELEIAEARWFSRDDITELTASGDLLLPPLLSISRWLVETWHGGDITGRWDG